MAKWPIPITVLIGLIPLVLESLEENSNFFVSRPCGLRRLSALTMLRMCVVQQCLFKVNQALKSAQERHPISYNSEDITQARKEVHIWLEREDMMWK